MPDVSLREKYTRDAYPSWIFDVVDGVSRYGLEGDGLEDLHTTAKTEDEMEC